MGQYSINDGTGQNPSVALNNKGVVVEVHESHNKHVELCYRVGMIDTDSKTICWGSCHMYDMGLQPHVAIDDSLNVVENHKSQNHETLWYHVGKVDADRKTITWGSSHMYDSGTSPSVAINDNLNIIEVHQTGSSILTYHVGTVQYHVGTVQ